MIYRSTTIIDPTRPGFVNTKSWLTDVREHADPHLTCILVGNKVDLCEVEDCGFSKQFGRIVRSDILV